jgi:UDP-N-acetylglucosamine acyltransferase
MTADVHPTAIVDPRATLADGVKVGPYCQIGAGVVVGEGSELSAHAVVLGPTRLGRSNRVHPFAVIGGAPQDRTYAGELTCLEIGDDNVFREHVTVQRGTNKGGGLTRIGSRCLLMVGVHVAHDVQIADDVTLTNLTTLGGHVIVEAGVVCGGQVAVAQFVRLGRSCFVAGGARVERDVPPFTIAAGDRARVRALNRVGLSRAGVPQASRQALKRAFRMLFRGALPRTVAIEQTRQELGEDAWVRELLQFLAESAACPAGR